MKTLLVSLMFLIASSVAALAAHPGGTVYADVNGMVCDFCARSLEKVFNKQEEVESIKVDLNKKVVTIHFQQGQKLGDEKITKLITDSGYAVRALRHGE